MKKRILSLILALCMLVGLTTVLPTSASAEAEDIFVCTYHNGNLTIMSCDPNVSGSLEIPSSLKGYPITRISSNAFTKCKNVTDITIPDSVNEIDAYAFKECTGLTNIIIPNSVTFIGYAAFSGCTSLVSVTIPGSVTSISNSAFEGCTGLTDIIISDGITSINTNAFYGCTSLTNITIPNSVTSIGSSAFYGCKNLTDINIPDSVADIGFSAFQGCTGLTDITIPSSVSCIDNSTFLDCTNLTKVTIPDSITTIFPAAFSGCTSLTDVAIPGSVTVIGSFSFGGCTGLTDIYYGGTEDEWNELICGRDLGLSENVTIHFNPSDKNEIKVILNDVKLTFDQPPVIENGRTLVPLRAIFEALDAVVKWDSETQTVTANKIGNTYVSLRIGSNYMQVNNRITILDVPAKIINGRTMVPIRAVAEAFNCEVFWSESTKIIIIIND